jgi:hypothetical protein
VGEMRKSCKIFVGKLDPFEDRFIDGKIIL